MLTFSSSLKANIKRYGSKNAMARTWQEVRQGKVARPPQQKRSKRRSKQVSPFTGTVRPRRRRQKDSDDAQIKRMLKKYPTGTYGRQRLEMKYGKQRLKTISKNPIIVYNPKGAKLIYGRAFIPLIKGIKTTGKEKGEHYEHKYRNLEVSIYGLSDGSYLVKPKHGQRLWANESDVDRYDRT